jgi:proton-coupled amino acid transporter
MAYCSHLLLNDGLHFRAASTSTNGSPVIARSGGGGGGGWSAVPLFNDKGFAATFGQCVLCFEGLALTLPLQDACAPRSQEKFLGLFITTIGCITMFWVVFATMNWFAIGNTVQTVLMLSLPPDDDWIAAVQIAYCIAVVFTFPLQLFPAVTILNRGAVKVGWFKKRSPRDRAHPQCCMWPENFMRVGVVALLAAISVVEASNMSEVVSLVGSFCFVPLAFVYPPLLHLKLVARTPFSKCVDVFLAVCGFCMMVYTSITTLRSWGQSPTR